MLDIALIREKPDWVKAQIVKLHDPAAAARIDAILALDSQRRALLSESERTQAARNKLNRAVGALRGDKKQSDPVKAALATRAASLIDGGDYDGAALLLAEQPMLTPLVDPHVVTLSVALDTLNQSLGGLAARVEGFNAQIRAVDADLEREMLWLPNLPHESVPVFDDESHNIGWKPEGTFYEFDFEPKPHWELGPALNIIDFERGIKIAGSRGYVLMGGGARLQRALVSLYLDLARQHGFTEVYIPFMVREESLVGAGQFPKFRENVYHDPDADIYFLPTSEVALTNLHRDEILDESQLPLYYCAHSPCFRRERASAGRDVRGIKRVHQFEKVELYKFTTPETSYAELESLTEAASDVCRALKLPFRRLEIVTGDLGFSATKKYDLEVWSPGCQEWLEVSSCSNTEDFQARRANVRYRPIETRKTRFVHTLNGSGLATSRVIIAIMENYQQADGTIIVPEALRPYLGGQTVIDQ
jgi:seryl-tRNA synthetase